MYDLVATMRHQVRPPDCVTENLAKLNRAMGVTQQVFMEHLIYAGTLSGCVFKLKKEFVTFFFKCIFLYV